MTDNLSRFREFKAAGPVAAAFMTDTTNEARFIRGPVGGGKTVSCIFDCLRNAQAMPVCKDGWIHFRVAVIGATYGQMERNLYPTWKFWLPDGMDAWTPTDWRGGGGRFATQTIKFWTQRNGKNIPVHFEAIFGAIGEQSVEVFMRGFEPTAWYLYEVDQLPDGIVENALGRLSRYPNAEMLGRKPDYRSYLVGDLNAPDIDSWYYRFVEEVHPPGIKQYVQPSGLSPKAENLQNLREGYYEKMFTLNAHRKKWVKRFIRNEYGPSDIGQPVYGDEWSDDLHLSRDDIKPLPGVPLGLGFDQGLTGPACVVTQRARSGQRRVLAEVAPGRMSPRRFAQHVRDKIAEVAPGIPIGDDNYADPAGFQGADKEDDQQAWAEIVARELDIVIQPAPTNEIDLRLQAVRDELTYMIDAYTPGIILSQRHCPILRKGFASHYMYEKRPDEKSQMAKPIKNIFSNPHDALQYQILGEKGRYGVIEGPRDAAAPQRRLEQKRQHGRGADNMQLKIDDGY